MQNNIHEPINKIMNTAMPNDFGEIMSVFHQHRELFPHIRTDKIKDMIASKNVMVIMENQL